ncbi:hypothetical protein PMAYCL1PPCAC_26823 [Pristionchus mayeri]|uniref:THAP-type domain-containing protein n=1 Tax=Pristionchus mayeri TaxID=1317129 RepID=A0AAN5D4S7_9BILA|nr:hypothetical protein PMAYCL1PPCAC_09638 [Pristionchus mayeri]GMR56628.1 hypothetical protein PMAYCL1PPCAC_26823 [Pristionchus mayeri]
MATVNCSACPRRSHQCRKIPDIAGMGREWLLRLNLIEDEFELLQEKVARIQGEGRRAWLCPNHFKGRNHLDREGPEDHRQKGEEPPRLNEESDVQPEPAPTVEAMVDAMSDLLFPSPQRTQSGVSGASGSYIRSQETTNTEVTSETGVQCGPPTPPSHDYFLVKKECLLSLFTRCHQCGKKEIEEGTFKCRTVGSALVLQWECLVCEREVEWHSQPMVERYFEGNLKLTSAVHTTSVSRPVSPYNYVEKTEQPSPNGRKVQ